MMPQVVIWRPQQSGRPWDLDRLAERTLAAGGRSALMEWAADHTPAPQVAYVHGERHDLWWEFTLEASFRWQAHLHRLRHDVYRQRLHRLTRALGLDGMLGREVASLTHGSRALADLAVALLPYPGLLLWAEPFYLMSQVEAARAVRLIQVLHAGGMGLVAVASDHPGLQDLQNAARWRTPSLAAR